MSKKNGELKVSKNIKSNYISKKIKIDDEGFIIVLDDIQKGEILMKGEGFYEEFGLNQSPKFTIIGEPYKKGNVRFIDKQTVQASKDIKKGDYVEFSDDEWHKPILFRAPNMFIYKLCLAIMGLSSAVIYVGLLYLILISGI